MGVVYGVLEEEPRTLCMLQLPSLLSPRHSSTLSIIIQMKVAGLPSLEARAVGTGKMEATLP